MSERGPNDVRRAATITDVASRAGVSRATVSRVINGQTTVNRDIAIKVREAVIELGYSPNGVARSLSLGLTHTVAMIVPNLGNPVFQQILRGVTIAAAADGYRLLVADSQEDVDNEEALARDVRRHCDAVILCSPRLHGDRLIELIDAISPTVVINRSSHAGKVSAIGIDYARGVRTLVDHLTSLGHERLAYLEGPIRSASNVLRTETLQQISATRRLQVEFISCGHTMDDGFEVWDKLQDVDATAVLAFNDIVALGLLGRLAEGGISVPDYLSIVGFDGVPAGRFASPSLTTMSFDHVGMGRATWRELRADMEGRVEHGDLMMPLSLVIRGSTGLARS